MCFIEIMDSQVSRVWTWEFPNFHFLRALRSATLLWVAWELQNILSGRYCFPKCSKLWWIQCESTIVLCSNSNSNYKKHVLASGLCNRPDQNWVNQNFLVLFFILELPHDLSFWFDKLWSVLGAQACYL